MQSTVGTASDISQGSKSLLKGTGKATGQRSIEPV
jgi:hypothetical protein